MESELPNRNIFKKNILFFSYPIKNYTVFSFANSFEPKLAVRTNVSKHSNWFEKTNFLAPKNLTQSPFKSPLPHQITRPLRQVFKWTIRGPPLIGYEHHLVSINLKPFSVFLLMQISIEIRENGIGATETKFKKTNGYFNAIGGHTSLQQNMPSQSHLKKFSRNDTIRFTSV